MQIIYYNLLLTLMAKKKISENLYVFVFHCFTIIRI
jgi:hypothetical protein